MGTRSQPPLWLSPRVIRPILLVLVGVSLWLITPPAHATAASRVSQNLLLEPDSDTPTVTAPSSPTAYPALVGMQCAWEATSCAPCANNVEQAFAFLRTHGDVMGFNLGDHPDPTGPFKNHWQGVQRLAIGDGRYIVVTRDSVDDPLGDGHSGLAIVEMGSQPTGGDRFRLNRLNPYFTHQWIAPNAADIIVETKLITDQYEHPGGIQAAGKYLAVGTGHLVHFYDVSTPTSPKRLTTELDLTAKGRNGSSTSLTMLADDRYLLIVGHSDAAVLDFYISNAGFPNQKDGFTHFDEWWPSEVVGPLGTSWRAFQSINLVTECGTGQLYMIGTGFQGFTSSRWFGSDVAYLYRLDKEPASDHARITMVANAHKTCSYNGQTNCNFDAAAGVFVDSQGSLNLLSTEHWNDGPGGTVKMAQFRSQYGSSCPTDDTAWVELFDHDSYRGRSLLIDYADRFKEDYTNFDRAEGFEDKASSVQWCLPPNQTFILYKDKDPCRGAYRLQGDGTIQGIANLHDEGYGDRFSCGEYVYDPPADFWIDVFTGKVYRYTYAGSGATRATISAAEPSITLNVPPLQITEGFTLTLEPVSPPPNVQTGLVSSGYAFWLQDADDPYGERPFTPAIEVTVQYDEDDLGDIEEGSLTLYSRDSDINGTVWTPLDQFCPGSTIEHNLDEDWIRGDVCQAGMVALLGTVPEAPAKWVLFDEAHENRNTLDWSRAQEISENLDWHPVPEWLYFGDLEAELADIVDFVRHESGALTADTLALYDVLMISAADGTYSPAELRDIRTFVREGGGLVVLADCGTAASATDLLSPYGITPSTNCLFKQLTDPADLNGDLTIETFSNHPAADGTATYLANWGHSLAITSTAEWLATTWDEAAWVDENGNDQRDVGEEGVFAVGATYDAGCGRVVALGDNAFNEAYYAFDNEDFMRSILEWVGGGQYCDPPRVYLPTVLR